MNLLRDNHLHTKFMAKEKPSTSSHQQDGEVFDAVSKVKLEKTHDVLDRPEKFAELFCDVAKNQVSVQTLIKDMIRDSLTTDSKARDGLLSLIKQAMNEDWRTWFRSAWGKAGLALWTVATLALGAWLNTLF